MAKGRGGGGLGRGYGNIGGKGFGTIGTVKPGRGRMKFTGTGGNRKGGSRGGGAKGGGGGG